MQLIARLPAPVARAMLRAAFMTLKAWWLIRRPDQFGTFVALHHAGKILLVRQSYQPLWTMPGGSIRAGESPASAAVRELREEVGVEMRASDLEVEMAVTHDYLARRDEVQFFALHYAALPDIRIDEREVIEARWLSPDEAMCLQLIPHLYDYLRAPPRSVLSK